MKRAKKRTLELRSAEDLPSADKLASVVERQMDMLKAYRSRQDDIVRGLGAVQKLIGLGSFEAAKEAMSDLMARDLKQAKDRVDNGAFALDIAIKAIKDQIEEDHGYGCQCVRCGDSGPNVRGINALSQIEILVPEAFQKTAPPPSPSGAS